MKTKKITKFFLYSLAGFLFFACVAQPESDTPEKVVGDQSLEAFVNDLVQPAIDSQQLAGLAVGVKKGDETLLLKTYGYADLEHEVPMPLNASFEIGSVTKQFTAAAILQLVEAGKLSLEDDFTQYVDFDTGGRTISIQRLLDHTSGIKGYTEVPAFFGEFSVSDFPRDTLLRMMENEPFDFEPGEAEIYNNTAYFILGLIIEEVSDQSYGDYVEEHLFSRAGMDNSYYCSNSRIVKDRAHGYDMSPEGMVRAAYLNHKWPYAAGSLCSTAEDLLKWNEALHGGKVLSDAMYQSLITPEVLNDGTELRYCKGISNFDYKGNQCISHGGGINGFLSESRYFPKQELTVVVLSNATAPPLPDQIADQISDELLDIEQPEPVAYDGDVTVFSGKYEGPARGRPLTMFVEGKDGVLLISGEEGGEQDTLNYYGSYWGDGGIPRATFLIKDGKAEELRYDHISGYYRLKKE
jgi:CubicO group peptidase (beta-lactamase class C family)